MGMMVFYEGDGRIAGEIPGAAWAQMRRQLPLAIDWMNMAIRHFGGSGKLTADPFQLAGMLREDVRASELNIINADELDRLFGWWEQLTRREPTHAFYNELFRVLREQTLHPDGPRTT